MFLAAKAFRRFELSMKVGYEPRAHEKLLDGDQFRRFDDSLGEHSGADDPSSSVESYVFDYARSAVLYSNTLLAITNDALARVTMPGWLLSTATLSSSPKTSRARSQHAKPFGSTR